VVVGCKEVIMRPSLLFRSSHGLSSVVPAVSVFRGGYGVFRGGCRVQRGDYVTITAVSVFTRSFFCGSSSICV